MNDASVSKFLAIGLLSVSLILFGFLPVINKNADRISVALELTKEEGQTKVSYYNADQIGSYRVIVEGIDADGRLGRKVYRYKVE